MRNAGYSPIPYGFERVGNKLVASEMEQKVLEKILIMKGQGMSLRAIASKLNEKRIPAKRGGIWYASTVRSILVNSLHASG